MEDLFSGLGLTPDKDGYGEYARLFPHLSEKGKEGRAASIFLACLSLIPEFGNAVLAPLGRPIGKTAKVAALTEVKFPKSDIRPDGLIAVRSRGKNWTCLVEFKVGGLLEVDQVEKYIRLAKDNSVDAVLTISNDIVPNPNVCPVKLNGRLIGKTAVFHISWMQILSHAQLLVAAQDINDEDHAKILREFIRFLTHKSTGVKGYEQMPACWEELVAEVRSERKLNKKDERVQEVVDGWSQEERDLAFILSQELGTLVSVHRKRAQKSNANEISSAHTQCLTTDGCLRTTLVIPRTAAPLDVELALASRIIRYSMKIDAPQDRTYAKACVSWLTRQLPNDADDELTILVHWKGKREPTYATLKDIRSDPYCVISDKTSGPPSSFTVCAEYELQKTFTSRKQVISKLEMNLLKFYETVGANLKPWVQSAPKVRTRTPAEEIVDEATLGGPNA